MQKKMAAIDFELLEELEEVEDELQEDGEDDDAGADDDAGDSSDDRGDDVTGVDDETLSELAGDDDDGGDDDGGDGGDDDQQQRSSHIPRDRFDTVNERAKAYAAMLRSQGIDPDTGERLQPAGAEGDSTGDGAGAGTNDEPFDFKAKRTEAAEALMEGDVEKYNAIQDEIDAERDRISQLHTQAAVAQARMSDRVDAVAAQMVEKYPFLDSTTGNGDQEAITEVVEWRDFYTAKGFAPDEALRRAVNKVGPGYAGGGKPPSGDDAKGSGRGDKARQKQALTRNAKTQQPPRTAQAGTGARADSDDDIDIGKLSEDDFAKLSPAEKKRLRGD